MACDGLDRLIEAQSAIFGGDGIHRFEYDADNHFDLGNRLRLVSSPTVSESYRYDGHGRRVLAWTTAGSKLSMYSATGQVIYQQLAPADQNKADD